MALDLILRRPREAFRDEDDYDVIFHGRRVGRVFKPGAGAPADAPWMWSRLERPTEGRAPVGYEPTRETMKAFAKSWREQDRL